MKKLKIETLSYVIICLITANICWHFAYIYKEEIFSLPFIAVASFFPMILALIITKIKKESWKKLGFKLNIKTSWKVYLFSIVTSILLSYLAVPLMILIFKNQVSISLSSENVRMILLTPILGIITSIELMGEELGWIGYLFSKLEKLLGTVLACIILGIIRGIYHFGIIIVMDYPIHGLIELTISNIFLSFLMVYMFKKSKSLFPCCILHGLTNLFPIILVYESSWYYNSIVPMAVSMIPAVLIAIYCIWQMKNQKMIENKINE